MVVKKIDLTEFSNILTDECLASQSCIVVDRDGNIIPYIKEYNLETKEAVLYKMNGQKVETEPLNSENPHLLPRFEGDICGFKIVTENKVLEGSKLMFKKRERKNKNV